MSRGILVGCSMVMVVAACSLASAQDVELEKIVVTPYRTEDVFSYNQGDVEVIRTDYLEKRDKLTLDEALSLVNGVDLIGGGKFGSASEAVDIRGALPRHTAYMLEGIKIYDPSNPSGYYVPSDFLVSGLKKIEVVKEPLSSLYGSSVMSGAINFLVKNPKDRPYVYLEMEGGSFRTAREVLELGGKIDALSYLFNAARIDSDGFSKAKEKNNNPEADAYQDTNFTVKLEYLPDEELQLGFVTRVIHSRTENDDDDDFNGIPEDDLYNISWNNELLSTLYLKKSLTRLLSYKIQAGLTSIYRRYMDDHDSPTHNDNYMRAWYRGKTYQLMNHFEFRPFSSYKALFGFDYTRDKADSYRFDFNYPFGFGFTSDSPKKTSHTQGYFIENIFTPIDPLQIDFAYRLERNALFKSHSVINGKIDLKVPHVDTELYTSYSQGFKAPSLYQLFDTARGNRALKPEDSVMWEAGLLQPYQDFFSLSFCYFHTDFKNLIDFVYTNPVFWIGQFKNAAKGESSGVELGVNLKVAQQWQLKSGYTYTRARQDFVDHDLVTIFRHRMVRIPENKAFVGVGWKSKKMELGLELSYIGSRIDRIWVGVTDEFVKMKSYLLGNITFNYNILDNTTLFMKINNVLDKDYERMKGYQEEKAAFYGGVRSKF